MTALLYQVKWDSSSMELLLWFGAVLVGGVIAAGIVGWWARGK